MKPEMKKLIIANLLQLVEDMAKLILLFIYGAGRLGIRVRPVDTAYGCQPYSSYFMFRHLVVEHDTLGFSSQN